MRNWEPAEVSVTVWRIKERTYTPTMGFNRIHFDTFQMSGLQLSDTFPLEGVLFNNGKQGLTVFINPWVASATLAQSLELTFSSKATSSFRLERDYLSTWPNWPLSQRTFNIWQWLTEMTSITKCPFLRRLLNSKLNGNPKISITVVMPGTRQP